MGGGVLTLMDTLSRRQAEQGAEVEVWFLPRPETPHDYELEDMFDEHVVLRRLSEECTGVRRYGALVGAVREAARRGNFDAIHLHSSKAGAVGRLATLFIKNRTGAVVYSPHGFAFLREDTSKFERGATRLAEVMLAKYCDGLVLTSNSERKLAESNMLGASTHLLNTGIPKEKLRFPSAAAETRGHRPLRVGMIGRVCYQKAPWRFTTVARALKNKAEFVWIGGGAQDDVERWLDDTAVSITGWLTPEELTRQIDELDILLFPTLWEGMALSLMQAQAQGVPAVVSDVVGNVDSVVHGRTGFVCSSDDELVLRVHQLLTDDILRAEMSHAAVEWAGDALLDTRVGAESISIYRALSVPDTLAVSQRPSS
ncbi:glycosyltransferase [Pseudarthrobacter sp. WHRI 8279]|uniref:glycosyltransferase n=1 Tax=Pseudarthrobacter sp. WHRI 8279 TaxID=3162566 RepID=UPI0032EB0707